MVNTNNNISFVWLLHMRLLVFGGIFFLGSGVAVAALENSSQNAAWKQTVREFQQVPCLTEDQLEFGSVVLHGLNYNALRVFRAFCQAPGIDFKQSRRALNELVRLSLSYEQVLAFESWSLLPGGTAEKSFTALQAVTTLDYEASRAFVKFCELDGVSADLASRIVPRLSKLKDSRILAARALFDVGGMTASQALEALRLLGQQNANQIWASETFSILPHSSAGQVMDALVLITRLKSEDAWIAKTLFESPDITPDEGWYFLVAFFANPPAVQEQQFFQLTPSRKAVLLKAFYTAGMQLIYKINNLHAITDNQGFEISSDTLKSYSFQKLEKIFAKLSPQVRSRYGSKVMKLVSSHQRKKLISELRWATAADRLQTARSLTVANIYALLAQGGELYDSSFRDILVPELQKRIEQNFPQGLIEFLHVVDPKNVLVSDFIVSLAQKGKLTTFFPKDSQEQERILDLVAVSAFEDEESLLLFSATFTHLLETLKPDVRTFLITRMKTLATKDDSLFSRQIGVILQYYLSEYPELLSTGDHEMITELIDDLGSVNLDRYLTTPFSQWKKDDNLSSLSIFHPDDDGRRSFYSNTRILLKSGYKPMLSRQFSLAYFSEKERRKLDKMIASVRKKPESRMPKLFASMKNRHFVIDFTKKKNGILISHSVSVYNNEQDQERLLRSFIRGQHEMFAQRGHSYWRKEQIVEPVEKLIGDGRITEDDLLKRRRFLSLGSCGGIKAYSKLNELFRGNVDILATIGTGKAGINDPYNKNFFEVIASNSDSISWKKVSKKTSFIFAKGYGRDYLQPGSLPAILHKMINEKKRVKSDS